MVKLKEEGVVRAIGTSTPARARWPSYVRMLRRGILR